MIHDTSPNQSTNRTERGCRVGAAGVKFPAPRRGSSGPSSGREALRGALGFKPMPANLHPLHVQSLHLRPQLAMAPFRQSRAANRPTGSYGLHACVSAPSGPSTQRARCKARLWAAVSQREAPGVSILVHALRAPLYAHSHLPRPW